MFKVEKKKLSYTHLFKTNFSLKQNKIKTSEVFFFFLTNYDEYGSEWILNNVITFVNNVIRYVCK